MEPITNVNNTETTNENQINLLIDNIDKELNIIYPTQENNEIRQEVNISHSLQDWRQRPRRISELNKGNLYNKPRGRITMPTNQEYIPGYTPLSRSLEYQNMRQTSGKIPLTNNVQNKIQPNAIIEYDSDEFSHPMTKVVEDRKNCVSPAKALDRLLNCWEECEEDLLMRCFQNYQKQKKYQRNLLNMHRILNQYSQE